MMIAIRALLLLALVFLRVTGAAASTNSAWSVLVWQSDDGLPNNIVTGLAQTQDGYLWVANPTRLARFDGVQFEEFPARNLINGFNQRITTLAGGRDGALWVATDRGVVVCLKSGDARVFTNNLPALFVESLLEDGAGALWIKNRGGDSIYRIADGQVTQLPMAGSYRSVTMDNRGRIWFVKNGEVGLFRNGQFETLVQLGKSGSARLTGAKAGGVWICLGSELFKFDEGKPPASRGVFKAQSAGTEPLAMLEDHAGAVWIGTSDSGLFRYDGKTFENIPVSHGQILSLLEDREGNIWVGTGGGGLERVQPRVVELEGAENGLPFQAVQSLCQDANGNVWAVTQNGLLICQSKGLWQTVSADTNWSGGRAACVTADRSGAIWIGINGGVLLLNNSNAVQASTVTNAVDNGLQFATGIGTFILGGLAGTNSFALTDTGGHAVTLQVGNNNASPTFSGILSGTGGVLNKIGAGTLTLGGTNVYTGSTTVSAGVLALAEPANLASSPTITINPGATLDVSQRANQTLTLNSGQTLAGGGAINGSLTNNPGSILFVGGSGAINAFSVSSTVSLQGTTFVEIINNGTQFDMLQASGGMVYGGTLVVSNLDNVNPFATGQSFQLFSAGGGFTGAFSNIVPATPGPGLAWDTSGLLSSGTLTIVSTPSFNSVVLSGTSLVVSGTNGTAGTSYEVLTSTNLALPLSQWTTNASSQFDGSGNFSFTNNVNPNSRQQFYLLKTP